MYWFSVNCWAVLPSDKVIVMSVSVGIYFKKKRKEEVCNSLQAVFGLFSLGCPEFYTLTEKYLGLLHISPGDTACFSVLCSLLQRHNKLYLNTISSCREKCHLLLTTALHSLSGTAEVFSNHCPSFFLCHLDFSPLVVSDTLPVTSMLLD